MQNKKLSRKDLSEKANVSYGSLKRFEETGNISLTALNKLTITFECTGEFDTLFQTGKPESIEEIINGTYQITGCNL